MLTKQDKRTKLSTPLLEISFAIGHLRDCRIGGYSVDPDGRQRRELESWLAEIQWWLNYPDEDDVGERAA